MNESRVVVKYAGHERYNLEFAGEYDDCDQYANMLISDFKTVGDEETEVEVVSKFNFLMMLNANKVNYE